MVYRVDAVTKGGSECALSLPVHLAELEANVADIGAALVILDPLLSRLSEPMEFVHLDGGMIVPLPAWLVVRARQRAGQRLRVDGGDIIIEPGVGLDAALLAELKRWKCHAIMLIGYVADDSHLRRPADV